MADAVSVVPWCSGRVEMEWFSAGKGSLTVLLMTNASGRNRYQSTATPTTAALTKIDLRVVTLQLLSQGFVREGREQPRPSGCGSLAGGESPGAGGKSPDRPERGEAPVVLDPERVDCRRAADLQHVQVSAVGAQGDIVHAAGDRGRGSSEQTERAVAPDGEGRHRAGAIAGEAEAPVVCDDGPARGALVGEYGATHDPGVAAPVQDVGRGRARVRGFGHEQQIAQPEREPERRPAGGGHRPGSAGHAVLVDGVYVQQVRRLLGDHE